MKVSVEVDEILGAVASAASTYLDHGDFYCLMARWLGHELSDEEIEAYCERLCAEVARWSGVDPEDERDAAMEALGEFKRRYVDAAHVAAAMAAR